MSDAVPLTKEFVESKAIVEELGGRLYISYGSEVWLVGHYDEQTETYWCDRARPMLANRD